MKLLRLSIQGFRSFGAKQVWKLPAAPAFMFVSGRNQSNPELGPNGVGKSSLIDALLWALYGKTSRGQRGPTVENRSRNDLCRVAVKFDMGGRVLSVIRTQRPNLLRVVEGEESRIVEQAEVDALLGFSYESACRILVRGQMSRPFLDLSKAEKLKVFSEALRLDVWTKVRAGLSKLESSSNAALQQANLEAAAAQARLDESLRTPLPDLSSLEAELLAAEKRNEAAQVAEEKHRREKPTAPDDSTGRLTAEMVEQDDLLREVSNRVAALRGALQRSKRDLTGFKQELERALTSGGACPVCYQPTGTPAHRKAAQAHIRGKIEQERLERTRLKQELNQAKERAQHTAASIDKLSTRLSVAEAALEDHKTLISQWAKRAHVLSTEAAAAHKEYGRLGLSMVDAKTAREKAEARIEANKAQAAAAAYKQAEATAALAAASEAIDVVRGLTLWITESALGELTVLANSYMERLGLLGWRVQFVCERQGSSGTSILGFDTLVSAVENPKVAVPWESWSGGEGQRLRVAVECALAEMIRARLPRCFDFEAWDEPTQHLSDDGVEDLLAFLRERSQTLDRVVVLIDHRSHAGGTFTHTSTVTKTNEGSILSR